MSSGVLQLSVLIHGCQDRLMFDFDGVPTYRKVAEAIGSRFDLDPRVFKLVDSGEQIFYPDDSKVTGSTLVAVFPHPGEKLAQAIHVLKESRNMITALESVLKTDLSPSVRAELLQKKADLYMAMRRIQFNDTVYPATGGRRRMFAKTYKQLQVGSYFRK